MRLFPAKENTVNPQELRDGLPEAPCRGRARRRQGSHTGASRAEREACCDRSPLFAALVVRLPSGNAVEFSIHIHRML